MTRHLNCWAEGESSVYIREIGQSLEQRGWEYVDDLAMYIQMPVQSRGHSWIEHVSVQVASGGASIGVFTRLYYDLGDNPERGKLFERLWYELNQMTGYLDRSDGQFVLKAEPLFIGTPDPDGYAAAITQAATGLVEIADWLCPIISGVGYTATAEQALQFIRAPRDFGGTA